MHIVDTPTLITLGLSIIMLILASYQTKLSRESLEAAKQSIDDAKTNRQLEILPKHRWVIEVEVALKQWQEDLQEKSNKMKKAVLEKNEKILKELSQGHIRQARDLALSESSYDKMPSWLREIWISGAQYYYDAVASCQYLWSDMDGPKFYLAEELAVTCDESSHALSTLRGYINNMIPRVILGTPASISDEKFFRK